MLGTIVTSVRQFSPAANQIKVGDRIISIDGEDVSQKNVKEVSKKFSQKKQNHRNLIVLPAAKPDRPEKLHTVESLQRDADLPSTNGTLKSDEKDATDIAASSTMTAEASLAPRV